MPATVQPDGFTQALHEIIKRRVQQIANEEAAAAAQRVTQRVNEELDLLALSVLQRYSIERRAEQLIITVHKLQEVPNGQETR